MAETYEPRIYEMLREAADNGAFGLGTLGHIARSIPADLQHVVAHAWDLVGDGELTYAASGMFRESAGGA